MKVREKRPIGLVWKTSNRSLALRHELVYDSSTGGPIGYEVRPSFRNQGVAKEI